MQNIRTFIRLPSALLWLSILSVTFIVTPRLTDPTVTGKYFYFATVMPLAILFTAYRLFRKKATFRLCLTDVAVLAFAAWASVNCIAGEMLPGMKLWMLMLLIPLYVVVRVNMHDAKAKRSLLYAVLLAVTVESIWGLLQLYGVLWSDQKFPVGSFFNSGPYSGFLACGISPALYFSLKGNTRMEKSAGMVCLTVTALALPASMSRAAWTAAVAGCMVVLHSVYLKGRIRLRCRHVLMGIVGIALAGVLLAAAYTLRPQSADGRLFIWRASVGLVRAKPITGHGLGSFPAKYDGAQADYLRTEGLPDAWTRNAATPEYAFNEYIQIATEHGIVGLLLFVGMVATAFGFRTHHQPDSCAMAVRGSLTAFLVFAFFSYPFSVLPLIVLFVMLMAMSATEVPPVGITLSQFSNIAVGILCLWLVGYASAEILARYPAYRAWSRVQMDYDSGYFAKAIAPYHRLYPKLAHEKTFLYEYARCLALTGRYPESNNELDRYLLLGSDPAIYYRKADNYRRMADYGAAERMYLRSLEMLPNRFHTLRLLLNLYDETGQTEKSQKIREMMERRWRRPIKERRGE